MFGKRQGPSAPQQAARPNGTINPQQQTVPHGLPPSGMPPRQNVAPPPSSPPVPSVPPAPAQGDQMPVAPSSGQGTVQNTAAPAPKKTRSPAFLEARSLIYNTLMETIDVSALAALNADAAKEEIRSIVSEIISVRNIMVSLTEQNDLVAGICNDILGFGPLETLLARDDIADIMVNGSHDVYIEVGGKIHRTDVEFRDEQQLLNICRRIVSQIGRRVDEASPICDARLLDGSRVNVIIPPLAVDGTTLTIRKFRKDKLTMDNMVSYGSISPLGARLLSIVGASRCNVLVIGGTGSGKTTLLNCMTSYISPHERVVTCEDAAELQLQQPHVVRLETRPPNLEGKGEVTMRDLVKNCLRMRPERIIVGEVRGSEAFDLLQAMNTGHDGSMGTLHANNPREGISRLEAMVTMGGFSLPAKTIREMIVSSIDVIVHVSRLRDGSRRIMHVTEVVGMEGEVPTLQDLLVFNLHGEDEHGNLVGQHEFASATRPKFWDRAVGAGLQNELASVMAEGGAR